MPLTRQEITGFSKLLDQICTRNKFPESRYSGEEIKSIAKTVKVLMVRASSIMDLIKELKSEDLYQKVPEERKEQFKLASQTMQWLKGNLAQIVFHDLMVYKLYKELADALHLIQDTSSALGMIGDAIGDDRLQEIINQMLEEGEN